MSLKNSLVLFALIGFAFVTRFLPHPPNFTAVGAMALFAGAKLSDKKAAFLIPLAAMILSDLLIGFHNTMIAVYLSFILIGLIGTTLAKREGVKSVALASIASSALFFIVTNFAVWLSGGMYPQNFGGLLTCYTMAIPFFINTLASDMLYNALLFGSYYLITQSSLVKQKA